MQSYADCVKTQDSMDKHCAFFGCMYNDDGFCKYADAPIKMNFARACYDEFYEPMEEFV